MKTYREPTVGRSEPDLGTQNGDMSCPVLYQRHRKRWILAMTAVAVALATLLPATTAMSASTPASASLHAQQPSTQSSQLMKQTTAHQGQQQQQQQNLLPSNEPHTINLIPVDQPVLATPDQHKHSSNKQMPLTPQPEVSNSEAFVEPSAGLHSEDPTDSSQGAELSVGRGELEEEGQLPAELRGERLYLATGGDSAQASPASQTDKTTGNRLVAADSLDGFQQLHAPIGQQQLALDHTSGKQYQNSQMVERRFGLFKKHHYGPAPMSMSSANYQVSPYLTDCERCLASLGPQSADIQQLEPMPVMPSLPPPQPVQPIHVPQPTIAHPLPAYSGHPLKSKLFMKFPFFMKGPMSFGSDSIPSTSSYNAPLHEAPPYWHHYQPLPTARPQLTNSALYLRPASAYNCIQASAPLVSAPSHQEVTLASTKGQTKQHQSQQQQQTFSSSQY